MKNPKWHRDEAILALDLYFDKNLGTINSNNSKIIALSELLNRLPIHTHKSDQQKFRNPNGVVMKLANFKALAPNYKGKGLDAHSKLEKEVFEEFCSDIERLHKIANKIRQIYDNREVSNKISMVKKIKLIL
jgi:5-methylcytosine-specific restriction protein A